MAIRRFMATADDVAAVVRAERAAARLTQAGLAEKAGVSRRFLADVEAGHPRAELAKVLQVLDALDVHALALPSIPSGLTLDDIDLDEVIARHA
ncbi:MAG TPA: helix-turn-helix domain-containing protein [Arachnia sp.]|jgi:y4mF family transcriptional regulator|nr:helix-turn-helix domain-containing protein [Arachnia sp.]HMR14587.1 helix-turn-helix domain-containing protein [Arachnia sp.]